MTKFKRNKVTKTFTAECCYYFPKVKAEDRFMAGSLFRML